MSYAMAGALQAALFQRLTGDAALAAEVGDAIYDAVPDGPLPGTYVSLGEEAASDRSDKDGAGARHDVTIAVISDAAGYLTAKAAATAVCDALLGGAPPALSRGRIVGLWFLRARARLVGSGDQRRIDLRFRVRTEDD